VPNKNYLSFKSINSLEVRTLKKQLYDSQNFVEKFQKKVNLTKLCLKYVNIQKKWANMYVFSNLVKICVICNLNVTFF
jgi:hypothetical protein